MARALGVSTTMVSQVLSGAKPLSLELTAELAAFLSLSERETDFLFLLVEHDRAGTPRLRLRVAAKIEDARKQADLIANRIKQDRAIDDLTRSVYYSSWAYTGIRNLLAVPGFGDVDAIAGRLMIPKAMALAIIDFLLEHGLATQEKGKLSSGTAWTHLAATSPFASVHHRNWRGRAAERMLSGAPESLHFTSPMSLSEEAAADIRRILLSAIERAQKAARPSAPETVRCLNIDWFDF